MKLVQTIHPIDFLYKSPQDRVKIMGDLMQAFLMEIIGHNRGSISLTSIFLRYSKCGFRSAVLIYLDMINGALINRLTEHIMTTEVFKEWPRHIIRLITDYIADTISYLISRYGAEYASDVDSYADVVDDLNALYADIVGELMRIDKKLVSQLHLYPPTNIACTAFMTNTNDSLDQLGQINDKLRAKIRRYQANLTLIHNPMIRNIAYECARHGIEFNIDELMMIRRMNFENYIIYPMKQAQPLLANHVKQIVSELLCIPEVFNTVMEST
jgi:hypothetical protein